MGLRTDGVDGHLLLLERVDQGDELLALGGVLQSVIVVTENRLRVRLVRELERLGDEVRPDDLQPQGVPQNVRATVGDGLVDDVPALDLSPVTAHHRVNVLAHPLEQLIPRRARSGVSTKETAAKTWT